MLVPTLRTSRIKDSLRFYTEILDFEQKGPAASLADPAFVILQRGDSIMFLSSHAGDGVPGQAVSVLVHDVDKLFADCRARGLQTPGDPDRPDEVHEGPLNQTWGTREFYVDDPDGNTVRFVEGFGT